MAENEKGSLIFGFPEDAEAFDLRHPLLLEKFPNLTTAIDLAFTRIQAVAEPADKFVFLYGRMCAEDFMEILLVCGNGYGAAGMKLLRSMYEHTVTLRYLHEHPEEVDSFMNYHHIQQRKLTRQIVETFGQGVLERAVQDDVEEKFSEVREQFMVTDCATCGTKRLNHTWSKLDFVAMAGKTGALGQQIVPAYLLPLRHAHASFGGLSDRLEIVDGRIEFQHQSQPEMADTALMIAHNCLLSVLEVQKERFNIPRLEEQLQRCFRDFLQIWTPDSR